MRGQFSKDGDVAIFTGQEIIAFCQNMKGVESALKPEVEFKDANGFRIRPHWLYVAEYGALKAPQALFHPQGYSALKDKDYTPSYIPVNETDKSDGFGPDCCTCAGGCQCEGEEEPSNEPEGEVPVMPVDSALDHI